MALTKTSKHKLLMACGALTVCLSLVTHASFAQEDPSKAALAQAARSVEITGVTQQFDAIIDALSQQVRQGIAASDPAFLTDEELKQKLDTSMELAKAEAEKIKPKLLSDVIELYARRFTAEELKVINAFLTSEIGSKFTKEAPKLMQDSLRLSQYWASEMGKAMNDRVRDELGARGYTFGGDIPKTN